MDGDGLFTLWGSLCAGSLCLVGPVGPFAELGFSGGDPNFFFGFCFLSNSGTGQEAASSQAGQLGGRLSAGDEVWEL